MKKFLVISALLAAAFVICGYAFAADPNTPAADSNKPAVEPNTAAATVETIDPNKVAATVDGVNITEGKVAERMAPQMQGIPANLPAEYIEAMKAQLKQQVLDGLIIEMLLDKEVEKQNITITEEQATEQLKQMASQQKTPLSLEEVKALVEASGQKFETVVGQIRKGMSYNKLIEKSLADMPEINEPEAKKFFDENPDKFVIPEQVRASHILIEFNNADPCLDPNAVKARAMETIKKVQEKLKAGEDFATVAKEYSNCPSATQGGDLDFFAKGRMVPSFEEAAFALKVGEMSDIVETPYGYHIIKLTDRKAAGKMTFDEVKAQIIESLKQQRQNEFAEKYVAELKQKATIVYTTPPPPAPGSMEMAQPQEKTEPAK